MFLSSNKKSASFKARFAFKLKLFLTAFLVSASSSVFSSEFVVESTKEVVLENLSKNELAYIASLTADDLNRVIVVELIDKNRNDVGKVWGKVGLTDNRLVFAPRFPFDKSQNYVATFNLEDSNNLKHHFSFATESKSPQTHVSQVYPSGDVLPENLFKFYIHFSRPMSRGQAYQHIKLLDQNNRPVALPFLELSQELWDPSGQRFTLLFDPGRTKKGIKPNRDMGLPLQEGKQFTLVVDQHWQDAEGLNLQKPFRKTFTVIEQDNTQPAIEKWLLNSPKAGSFDQLRFQFEEPLDHAQLKNAIWIENDSGNIIEGKIELKDELVWALTPNQPWRAGQYKLFAKSYLEDRAANSLGRAFELIRGEEDPVIPDQFSRSFSIQ